MYGTTRGISRSRRRSHVRPSRRVPLSVSRARYAHRSSSRSVRTRARRPSQHRRR